MSDVGIFRSWRRNEEGAFYWRNRDLWSFGRERGIHRGRGKIHKIASKEAGRFRFRSTVIRDLLPKSESSDSDPLLFELPHLKGQCHEIFCFRFFLWITFPQAPDNNIRIISNFFKNSGDIRKSRCTTGVNDTGGKEWEQYQAADTWKWTWGQKFIHMFPLLLKGDQTKLLKFFWLKIFSKPWAANISANFQKNSKPS